VIFIKRVTEEEIEGFLSLYKESKSLRAVSRHTGRSVNTIKAHLLPLTEVKELQVVKEADLSDAVLLGTYVGLWMGDGTQYYDNSYTIKICSNKQKVELNEFIQNIYIGLFNKKTWLLPERETNRTYIKLKSKFIYNFIYDYVSVGEDKTLSVKLKNPIHTYSEEFLDGWILGSALSDGYLKKRFMFNVTSEGFSNNVFDLLRQRGMIPRVTIQDRSKLGWNDLHMLYLTVEESKILLKKFDEILVKLGCNYSFKELKGYGPAGI